MTGPSSENDRRKSDVNKGNGAERKPDASDEGLSLPDRGLLMAEGTYSISVVDENGEPKRVISAGSTKHYADVIAGSEVIVGTERLGEVMLSALGVKKHEDAERALIGDSGQPTSSSTTVGWNKKYSQGWDKLWGSSSN
jgi:hypothetical protein